jgi:hypothetical protein
MSQTGWRENWFHFLQLILTELGLDRLRQFPARDQTGAGVVDDAEHEIGSAQAGASGSGHQLE